MVAKPKGESRAHGKQKKSDLPTWAGLERDEIENTVAKLAREGKSTAMIGVILRDRYAVPSVKTATEKTISQIVREAGAAPEIPEDMQSLMRRAVSLRAHLSEHGKDHQNARGLQLIESRIRRLAYYYKKKGKLPAEWKYSRLQAKIAVD